MSDEWNAHSEGYLLGAFFTFGHADGPRRIQMVMKPSGTKGAHAVMWLAWIGQLLLFFILWRALHWLTYYTSQHVIAFSTLVELAVNLALAIVLLVVIDNLHSAWWLMGVIGAAMGVVTGTFAPHRSKTLDEDS